MINNASSRAPQFRRRERPASTPASSTASTPDYEVGFGKPPKEHRFKPGQSGNPRGRPRGARGVNATVRKVLEQKTSVQTSGGTKKMAHVEVIIRKLLERALKGDTKAAEKLLLMYRTAAPEEVAEREVVSNDDVSAGDAAILAAYHEHILSNAAREDGQ